MLKLGMLEMTSAPACVNGFFGMPKGDTDIRLILDARAANCLFVDPPHVQLPIPSDLAQLLIPRFALVGGKARHFEFLSSNLSPSWIRPFSLYRLCLIRSCLSSLLRCLRLQPPQRPLRRAIDVPMLHHSPHGLLSFCIHCSDHS